MKFSIFLRLGLLPVTMALLLPVRSAGQSAPVPSWWSNGVLDTNPNNPADNWAMANVGQLKNLATKARAHIDLALGTSQADWDAAYAPAADPLPFSTTTDPDNFSAITIGQLKFVAAGFYRLLQTKAPAYDARARLLALGVPATAISGLGPYFPWISSVASGENYSTVTIGQLKLAFAFDLTNFAGAVDHDGNGLPDVWQMQYFGHLGNSPGALSGNGDGLTLLLEYRLGTDPRSTAAKTVDSGNTTQMKILKPTGA